MLNDNIDIYYNCTKSIKEKRNLYKTIFLRLYTLFNILLKNLHLLF